MSNTVDLIQQELDDALERDQLDLPTLPEVALKIRDTATKPDISPKELAGVVAEDPALATRFVRIANSPMFRAIREIDDLQQAIGRIGVEYAANLAAGLAIENMFQATSELVDRKMRSTWTHACEVAAISGVLAKSFTNLRPDQATLAGLIHTIGVLPILTFAEENPSLIRDSFALDQIIQSLHGRIGMKILQHWEFSDDLILVPGHYLDFERHVAEADFVDLVMVSYLQTRFGSDHPHGSINWSEVPAFNNVGLDPEFEDAELEEYHEDVATAKVMLV